jgi:molybdopterin-guanine dinucleotide biosynthesis protein A
MQRLTAVLLCGGQGARLGGIDKPLRMLAGRPLIEHVLERLRPQADEVIVSANRNVERYRAYSPHVVDDGAYADRGPLAGLHAGLAVATHDLVLCVPGDAPHLPSDLALRLDRARTTQARAIAVVDDGSGLQPLCCLLPRARCASLARYLASGGDAPRAWLDGEGYARADCSDWPRWSWSLNDEAEWSAVEARLHTGASSP